MHSVVRSSTAIIRATPERVWAMLTTPEETRRYFDFIEGALTVESTWATGASVAYRTKDGTAVIEGVVLEAEPPARLVTSFAAVYDAEVRAEPPSRMEWTVEPHGPYCILTTMHQDTAPAPRTARDAAACLPSILAELKALLETGRPRPIKAIVVDCASPAVVATFWAAALGYLPQGPDPEPEDPFIGLADPRGEGPELGFQRVPEGKTVKNRVHLDLRLAGGEAEIERLLALGARRAPGFPQDDGRAVLLDPEGNEFCVEVGER